MINIREIRGIYVPRKNQLYGNVVFGSEQSDVLVPYHTRISFRTRIGRPIRIAVATQQEYTRMGRPIRV